MRLSCALLTILVLGVFLLGSSTAQPLVGGVSVTIYPDGSALVTFSVETGGAPIVELDAIGIPDTSLGIMAFNERNELLPVNYDGVNNTLTILALNSNKVTVSYVTLTLTTKIRDLWLVNFTTPLPTTVELPPNATLSGIYTEFTRIMAEGDRVLIQFPTGPVALSYTLLQPLKPRPPPAGSQTQQPPSAPPQQPSAPQPPATGSQQPSTAQPWPIGSEAALIAATALAVAVVVAVLLRRKPREELSETDLEIIRALQSAGGGMFQSELAAKLNLPTTTLWRRLRRLQELGYVVVERRGGRNYIKLT